MTKTIGLLACITLSALFPYSVQASQVLDFSNTGCSFNGGGGCLIPQTYGDSALVDVSSRTIDLTTGTATEGILFYDSFAYGDLHGVAYAGLNSRQYAGEITFRALNRASLSLTSFDFGTYLNSSAKGQFKVSDLAGNVLVAANPSTAFPGHGTLNVNSGPLDGFVIRWGPDSYNVGIDNIRFEAVPLVTAIPESSTWAMMIIGFGAVGHSIRGARRKNRLRFRVA